VEKFVHRYPRSIVTRALKLLQDAGQPHFWYSLIRSSVAVFEKGGVMTQQETSQEVIGRRLVYFAAERTLMAWIRSSLGLMALGFVIDRFGLIFRQVLPTTSAQALPKEFSFWMGASLVMLGTLMACVAAVRYYRFSRAYHREGGTEPRHGILIGVLFTTILALLGFVIFVFLVIATD
jgi:putative membrane protein